jgi:hypothetical protein
MNKQHIYVSIIALWVMSISACVNANKNDKAVEDAVEENFETAEPTLLGKWKLRNFESNGNQRFDECDAKCIWEFTEEGVGKYQGKNLYKLTSTVEDPACRLYGFVSEWEEPEGDRMHIEHVKVGKGNNRSGQFVIDELTTKTLVLKSGPNVYTLER